MGLVGRPPQGHPQSAVPGRDLQTLILLQCHLPLKYGSPGATRPWDPSAPISQNTGAKGILSSAWTTECKFRARLDNLESPVLKSGELAFCGGAYPVHKGLCWISIWAVGGEAGISSAEVPEIHHASWDRVWRGALAPASAFIRWMR